MRDMFTIDGMMFLVPALVFSVLAAYQAMRFTAMRRYAREDAEARAKAAAAKKSRITPHADPPPEKAAPQG